MSPYLICKTTTDEINTPPSNFKNKALIFNKIAKIKPWQVSASQIFITPHIQKIFLKTLKRT